VYPKGFNDGEGTHLAVFPAGAGLHLGADRRERTVVNQTDATKSTCRCVSHEHAVSSLHAV
jgi:hypothetical protein